MRKIYKNFSIEDYNSGMFKAETLDNRPVRIICTDRRLKDNAYPIVYLLEESKQECLFIADKDGVTDPSSNSLCLVSEEFEDGDYVVFGKVGYIGVFKKCESDISISVYVCINPEDKECKYKKDGVYSNKGIRLATFKERELLDKVLESSGIRWDSLQQKIVPFHKTYEPEKYWKEKAVDAFSKVYNFCEKCERGKCSLECGYRCLKEKFEELLNE